jgi:hypothetical protein
MGKPMDALEIAEQMYTQAHQIRNRMHLYLWKKGRGKGYQRELKVARKRIEDLKQWIAILEEEING